jgi:hypothetical protein
MEHIITLLAASTATQAECEVIIAAIHEYGRDQWIEGFNRAANIAGHGTPPEPQIRTELRHGLKPTGI